MRRKGAILAGTIGVPAGGRGLPTQQHPGREGECDDCASTRGLRDAVVHLFAHLATKRRECVDRIADADLLRVGSRSSAHPGGVTGDRLVVEYGDQPTLSVGHSSLRVPLASVPITPCAPVPEPKSMKPENCAD